MAIGPSPDDSNIDGYQFLLLNVEDLSWQSVDDKSFEFHALDPEITLNIQLDGDDSSAQFTNQANMMKRLKSNQQLNPVVLLLSSGELTPFVITLRHARFDTPVTVVSDGVSGVEIL